MKPEGEGRESERGASARIGGAAGRFKAMLDAAEQGIAEFSLDLRITYLNPKLCSQLGYTAQELVDRPASALVSPEDLDTMNQILSELDLLERPEYELRMLRKDGSDFVAALSAGCVRGSEEEAAGIVVTVTDVSTRRATEQESRRLHAELSSLCGDLLRAHDEQKRRLARQLHDSTAQLVAGLSMKLAMVGSVDPASPRARTLLADCVSLAAQSSREVRAISYALHPPLLDELGIESALKYFVDEFGRQDAFSVQLHLEADFGRLSGPVETALFRIIQEAMELLRYQAGARQTSIRLERKASHALLQVTSEGADRELSLSSPGVLSMRERARHVGGKLLMYCRGGSTCIEVDVPLPKSHETH